MKTKWALFSIISISVFVVFAFSYNWHQDRFQQPVAEIEEKFTPIWYGKYKEREEAPVLAEEKLLNRRPTFYQGQMPLKFKVAKGENHPLSYSFGDFQNFFIYHSASELNYGIAEGAYTIDKSGRLVAEARLLPLVFVGNRQLVGINIEEFHYGLNGELTFKCESRIDFPFGFKRTETNVVGKKERDYYFLWPVKNF